MPKGHQTGSGRLCTTSTPSGDSALSARCLSARRAAAKPNLSCCEAAAVGIILMASFYSLELLIIPNLILDGISDDGRQFFNTFTPLSGKL